MTQERKLPKFAMEFVGFASMGSTGHIEATIAMTPEYDIKSVSSDYVWKDGSRVIQLNFGLSDKKLGRKGYSLKEEWKQEPPKVSSSNDSKLTEPKK